MHELDLRPAELEQITAFYRFVSYLIISPITTRGYTMFNMFKVPKNLKENYSPLYFLSALGAGGMTVTFFMYLMFMTPHEGSPMATWDTLYIQMTGGDMFIKVFILAAMTGIVIFATMHIHLLIWNIREFKQFKKTEAFQQLKNSNAEVQLMALPLTYAMTVNVGFILGALFVPNLWSVVEYLFPLAQIAFGAIGVYAMWIFIRFFSRILVTGHFDCSRNNNLSQMLAIFAFSMVGVGFSASAAMSHNTLTSGIGIIFSVLFITVAALFAVVKLILGFRSMLEHGIDRESSVSLWIIIPILTLIGIAIFRLSMAMHHNFGTHIEPISSLLLFSIIGSVQLLFGLLGYMVMKRLGYFKSFIHGSDKSVASYALICPGVASYVMAFFFIHQGLIAAGLVEQFSPAYVLLLIPVMLLQYKTVDTLLTLNDKLLFDKHVAA